MEHSCIFCKIIAGEIPAKPVADYGDILVIRDIAPKAPTHLLIIPKKHLTNVASFAADDAALAGLMLMAAQRLAQELPELSSFRLVINNGADAGQSVFHLHMHLLAGKKMYDL